MWCNILSCYLDDKILYCRQDTEEVKEEIAAVDFQRNTSKNPFAQIHGDALRGSKKLEQCAVIRG